MKSSSAPSLPVAYPILGFPVDGIQKILLIAPDHSDVTNVTCELIFENKVVQISASEFRDSVVRLYEFKFSGLNPGQRYSYRFVTGGSLLEVGGGLSASDLNFDFQHVITDSDQAILVSCNGVNDFHEKDKEPFAMWERLHAEVSTFIHRPRIIINGGDQYYQDAMEEKWLKKLTDADLANTRDACKRDSLANALKHMNNVAYRKLMAQIPSVAMLDDHDITDGAGGRAEYFVNGEFTAEYTNFAAIQLELFELLQASRNPAPILRNRNTGFSFVLDLGDSALVGLDLRTQKISSKELVMSQVSEQALFDTLRNLKHKNVMLLIPVVPFRNARELEGRLLDLAKFAAWLVTRIKPINRLGAWVYQGLKTLAGLEDDLSDALSSETNFGFLTRLLRKLAEGAKRGTQYTVLSGDIHTGGTVQSFITVGDFTFKLPIIVSSPIGYGPMPFFVEPFLKERKVLRIQIDDIEIRGMVDAFTTERNFVIFKPSGLNTDSRNESCWLYQEGIEGSKMMPIDGWRQRSYPQSAIFSDKDKRVPEIEL